ncbi:MAG TPA: HD domain-containing protein [Chloroflexota bacterium]|nr:HD domain-containing protein [Chloroflexota bacterium]
MSVVHEVVHLEPDGITFVPAPERKATVSGLAKGRRVEIHVPARHNDRLRLLLGAVNSDPALYQIWCSANVNAIDRLGMSDHGPVHVQIVANIAVKLLRMLVTAGGTPSLIKDYGLTINDAEAVVLMGALFHDSGMAIHRLEHEANSLIVAQYHLPRILEAAYGEPERTILVYETLHTIISHRAGGKPLTLEAGIVRVADALDMAQGRSRIPYQAGQVNIHSVSAAAIERVTILPGQGKPVRILITMLNSAGVYQLDELLRDKLQGSGLEPYIEVEAMIEGECEKRLIDVVRF